MGGGCLVSDRVMMADKVVEGKAGGYVSSEGVNGTFGIVMSARVENILSTTACSIGCSPPCSKMRPFSVVSIYASGFEKAFKCNHNSNEVWLSFELFSAVEQPPAPPPPLTRSSLG